MDVNLAFCEFRDPPEKASGQHHTHQDPKESKHLERCQGKGKEGERKSQKAGSQSDEASSICVWILVSGSNCLLPGSDQMQCLKKKWLLPRASGTCSPVLKGWGLLFVCIVLKEGSKRAISASRRKENRSPSTENISAWHNVQAHWHAGKSIISLRLSKGTPALLCAVTTVWPRVNHLASLRIKHPSYQRPSIELSEHWWCISVPTVASIT